MFYYFVLIFFSPLLCFRAARKTSNWCDHPANRFSSETRQHCEADCKNLGMLIFIFVQEIKAAWYTSETQIFCCAKRGTRTPCEKTSQPSSKLWIWGKRCFSVFHIILMWCSKLAYIYVFLIIALFFLIDDERLVACWRTAGSTAKGARDVGSCEPSGNCSAMEQHCGKTGVSYSLPQQPLAHRWEYAPHKVNSSQWKCWLSTIFIL